MPLKLVQLPSTPYWQIHGTLRGIRVRESTGVIERKAAEEILVKRAAEIQHRSIHGDSVSVTFAEAALDYIEGGGERDHLNPIIREIGRQMVDRIGQHEIDEMAKTLGRGKSPSTLNRQVYTPTVAVLHHAARKKWCAKPVVARPKVPTGRVRWITEDEAERLIAAAAEHLRPLVVFLLSTGCRLSEALYLQWDDVDLSRGHVSIYGPMDDDDDREIRTKNGQARGIPLHPRVVAALASVPWDRTGSVFRRPAGKIHKAGRIWLPYEPRQGGGGQVKTAWAGMCKRASVKNFTPHDCRHTWATWHYAANRDFRALMELGGWKSPDMVFRYAHINTDHLASSIGKLWNETGSESVSSLPKEA